MSHRDVYLKIEPITDYSPVEPMEKAAPPIQYKRDCFRNPDHEDGTIPESEVNARRLRALVYREYTDASYLVPVTNKIVNEDINEPIFSRRVPGTVIYTTPGEHLYIHVLNCDLDGHSLHVHGLEYGIDSDGAWPLGVERTDGLRSDEICPGDSWTYVFDVTTEMIGAWPFHDHAQHAGPAIEHGLFGGLIVLPKEVCPPEPAEPAPDIDDYLGNIRRENNKRLLRFDALPRHVKFLHHDLLEWMDEWALGEVVLPRKREKVVHIPMFLHHFSDSAGDPLFGGVELEEGGGATFTHTFIDPGNFEYFCEIHPDMEGTVDVNAGATPGNKAVSIVAGAFVPDVISVQPGSSVTWTNNDPQQHHTVTSRLGANEPTHCLNGRAFVGNSPTIEVWPGQKLIWYVFNLDLGTLFHNFHPHAMRWEFAGESADVRTISPAESFVLKTVAPEVIHMDRLPAGLRADIEELQEAKKKPKGARKKTFKGEFPFHCHVHHHMMGGMIGIIRVRQELWVTKNLLSQLRKHLGVIIDDGLNNCPNVDIDRCKKAGEGEWLDVAGTPGVTMMHSALMPETNEVLFFGYDTNLPGGTEYSRTWDADTGIFAPTSNQLSDLTPGGFMMWSMWSAGHAFVDTPEGHLLVNGGYRSDVRKAYLFNPGTRAWSVAASTANLRFYPTTITLADGNVMTMYGSGSKNHEIFTPGGAGSWSAPVAWPAALNHHRFYPWTWVLPDGSLFVAGPHDPTHRVELANPANNTAFSTVNGNRSTGAENGSAVLLTLRPPDYRPKVIIMGGDPAAAQQTAEIIDLDDASPSWTSLPNLNAARAVQFTATLLPDGRVMIAGGINGADGGPAEIYDPQNPAAGWQLGPVMARPRVYHSSLILLKDGSVLAGGDPKSGGVPNAHERYLPGYMSRPRPGISNAPADIAFGATFQVDSAEASFITEVVLMRPGVVTHGYNMSQRSIECVISGGDATSLDVVAPPNGNVAPPGWYLLHILDGNRVPSIGRWIRLHS